MVYGGKSGIKMELRKFYKRLRQLCYHTMTRSEIVTPHTSAGFLNLRCFIGHFQPMRAANWRCSIQSDDESPGIITVWKWSIIDIPVVECFISLNVITSRESRACLHHFAFNWLHGVDPQAEQRHVCNANMEKALFLCDVTTGVWLKWTQSEYHYKA